ncbi:BTAD domain-containing putative transcriptional regulator [Micromonospora sp. NPDC049230]|uniref:AfsR/SARP family transcriptional regulator n=1 Tax=Micromonospora sp. NPDC049230 TaxID=3155502 RepID=UPI003404DE6A
MQEDVVSVAVLGPLRVSVGGSAVALPGPGPRMLLGVLALSPGQPVSPDQLVELIWGPERGTHAALHTSVYRLRAWLRDRFADRVTLERADDGYLLRTPRCEVDTAAFRDLVVQGAAGTESERIASLDRALDLWRGPVLGAAASWLHDAPMVVALERERQAAARDLAELCLRVGDPSVAVRQLQRLVDAHLFDEPLHALLIRALGANGAVADALRLYDQLRARLATELGIDPSQELQRLYQQLLRVETPPAGGDPGAPELTHPTPRQLPAPPPEFTGRDEEVAALCAALLHRRDDHPPLVAVDGVAGVGKSALALHVASRVASSFPDGQLYVNLRGAGVGMPPLEPSAIVGRWLRQLGVAGSAVPAQLADATALWRSLLAGKRLLLLFDDAVSPEQIRALLPSGPGCATLVTSRSVLSTLDCTSFVRLQPLSTDDAVTLISRLVGERRVSDDPAATDMVVNLCEHLPLLLRIVSARLMARPSWTIRAIADRLSQEQRRLDELQVDNLSMRASLAVGLRGAGDDAIRGFPFLGLLGVPEVDLALAAALAGSTLTDTEAAMERLVDARLVDSPAPNRFRMHDVIRLYAREQAERHLADGERRAALGRVLAHYLSVAEQARFLLDPNEPVDVQVGPAPPHPAGFSLPDQEAAREWIDSNAPHLPDVMAGLAARPEHTAGAARLALLAYPALAIRDHWPEMIRLDRIAIRAAQASGQPEVEALARNHLGMAYGQTNQLDEGLAEFRTALELWEGLDDRHHTAKVLNNLGILNRMRGDLAESARCHERCITLFNALGDSNNEARGLQNLAVVERRLGRYANAVAACEQAVEIFRSLGDDYRLGLTLGALADCVRLIGRPRDSVAIFEEGLVVLRQCGNRFGEAQQLWGLGLALDDLGDRLQARSHWQSALDVLRECGYVDDDDIRAIMAEPTPSPPAAIRNST